MRLVARRIYGAADVVLSPAIVRQLEAWEAAGWGRLPVCFAKTPYSFSTDPAALGAPSGHNVEATGVKLMAGAGFVVALCGEIRTMPGLPRHPAALDIKLVDGVIEGLS